MEVILKEDITNLGYKNDIVKVKNGYARNYLIPRKLAVLCTDSAKKVNTEDVKQKAFKEAKILKDAQKVADSLKDAVLSIGAKASTNGKIFGSVNSIQVAEAIKKQYNYDVDRKKITVDSDNIKELGSYSAKINLHKEIKVEIKFEVVAE